MKLYQESPDLIFLTQNSDPFFAYLSKKVFSQMSAKGGKRVLDLGCGTGRNIFLAAKAGFRATGVDYSQKAIEIANRYAKQAKLGSKVNFIHADLSNLKRQTFGKFDYCILMEVIEHLQNYQAVIDFAFSSLKKGGKLLITAPNDPGQWTMLDDYARHIRRFTPDLLAEALAGFKKNKIYTIGFPLHRLSLRLYHLIRKLQQKEHNPQLFRLNSFIIRAYNLVGKLVLAIDDLVPPNNLGTTIIAIAEK